jgi:hypothetical protein
MEIASDSGLMALIRSIIAGDAPGADRVLSAEPQLARAHIKDGATRQDAESHFLPAIRHYLYAGDTPLHAAAAAYRVELARLLIGRGAEIGAANRRGAMPLHYAADGTPGSPRWDPEAQGATIVLLVEAGADVNAPDKGGTTPLHRAVRNRCAAAVAALLDCGADVNARNKRGSTPAMLTLHNTGRGGSGSPEAKAQLSEIVELLRSRA